MLFSCLDLEFIRYCDVGKWYCNGIYLYNSGLSQFLSQRLIVYYIIALFLKLIERNSKLSYVSVKAHWPLACISSHVG